MHVDRLVLRQFRNHEESDIALHTGVNVFEGKNAQGKTSILEGLYLCLTGRSFRCHQLKPLLREGSSFFSVEIHFTKRGIQQQVRFSFDGNERTIFHNNVPCSGTAELLSIFQGVLLSMSDMHLIKGAPQQRRQFIDLHLAQSSTSYTRQLARYQRAMRQRNHQLRSQRLHGIEVWEEEMARAGAYIVHQRKKAVEQISKRASHRYEQIADGETLQLAYKTQVPSEEDSEIQSFLFDRFQELREKEAILGHTLTGPHRDDMQIRMESRRGKEFASEGQQYGCVAALRLAEWDYLREKIDDIPILLIDDVGLPLDTTRKKKLFSLLKGTGQVLLTTPQSLPQSSINESYAHHRVSQGRVTTSDSSC